MHSSSLYRLYRPLTFRDVVGQKSILKALTQAIKTKQIAHAYLFCGTRGTGKTSLARILARAMNCPHHQDGNPCNQCSVCRGILDQSLLDVIEIDAASNNSVDFIRKLTDEVVFTPTQCTYKVYIIDEVHMLSIGAFNALLKTLEEPPAHVVFILATTEPHKIPQTILSRCQRYDLKNYSIEELVERLKKIAQEQNILADESALLTLARLGEGSFRDAISLLDQCRNQFSSSFTRNDVLRMVGMSSDEELFFLLKTISLQDYAESLKAFAHLLEKGLSPQRLAYDLASFFRDVLVFDFTKEKSELLPYLDERLSLLKAFHQQLSLEKVRKILLDLATLIEQLKKSLDSRISFELFLLLFIEKYFKDTESTFERMDLSLASMPKEEKISLSSVEDLKPIVEPITEPIAEPSIEPSVEPIAEPIAEPSVEPIAEPIAEPSVEPSVEPSAEPIVEPTVEPIDEPIVEPSVEPTVEPIAEPSVEPIVEPTVEPIDEPSVEPSVVPIDVPQASILWQECLAYIQGKNPYLAELLTPLSVQWKNYCFSLTVKAEQQEAKEKLKQALLQEQLLKLLKHKNKHIQEKITLEIIEEKKHFFDEVPPSLSWAPPWEDPNIENTSSPLAKEEESNANVNEPETLSLDAWLTQKNLHSSQENQVSTENHTNPAQEKLKSLCEQFSIPYIEE